MKNLLKITLLLALAIPSIEAKNASKKIQNTALLQDEYDECCTTNNSCTNPVTEKNAHHKAKAQVKAEEQSFFQTVQNYLTSASNWFKKLFSNDCCDCSSNKSCTPTQNLSDDACENIDSDAKPIPYAEK